MAQKQFNRFGLRRDLNLSDLPSATAALNNILSNPTMLGSEESFTTEDLDPIQGIYITNITASTFASLDGVTVAFTIVDNGIVDNSSNPRVYKPLIKIKNRLDAAYFSTGEPFFFGGDGPNARYYDDKDIVRDAPNYSAATDAAGEYGIGDIVKYNNRLWRRVQVTQQELPGGSEWADVGPYTDIFFDDDIDNDGNIITLSDNFWEQGQFVYSDKLQASFLSLFGGTNWQGFYKPTVSGTTTFLLNTTGSTIFKFQDPATQSFQAVRYGAPSDFVFNYFNAATPISEGSTNYKQSQVDEILAIYNDPTRQLVEVELEDAMNIKHGDLVYLDVEEGQVPAQRYRVLTFFDYDDVQEIPRFHIEVTEEFNKLNLDSSTLPTASGGYSVLLNTGSFSKDPNITVQGLKAVVRYTPYNRKNLKTYLNSYRHRIDIDLNAGNAITSATTFTVSDEVYENIMINDFIYDYRIANVDVDPTNTTVEEFESEQGVRRYVVTSCSSSGGVNTITVEIDDTYTDFEDSYNNDQQYYFRYDNTTSEYSVQAQFELDNLKIQNTYTTGSLNHTLYSGNTFNKLIHVARMGELTTRQRYITIDQYLDRYVDYIFDWTFFMKDDDVDANSTNKAWILRQRTETSGGYGFVSYKYLYDKDYEFYQIGDFKTFLDNSVLTGGTSREDGVDQRAFGKKQLLTAGDQYNTLYSLLPIKSIYTPQESWNSVALSRSGSIDSDSRLLSLNNATDVEIGNYVVEDSLDGHVGNSTIPAGTRIIDVLQDSGSIVLNKEANIGSTTSYNVTVFDHRGFVTTANHTQTSPTGQTLPLTDQINQTTTYTVLTVPEEYIDEIDLGHIIVFKSQNQTTYCRATRFEKVADNELAIEFDDQMPYPAGGGNGGLCAIYRDRGIDIIKPLETFCSGTACAQNNYDATTDKVKTKYILIDVDMSGTPSTLDDRWNEASITAGGGQNGYRGNTGDPEDPYRKLLDRTGSKDRTTIPPSEFANIYQDSVAYWCDGAAGLRDDWNMARLQGGTTAPHFVSHQQGTFIGCKQYGGNTIFANLHNSGLKNKLIEDGFDNFASYASEVNQQDQPTKMVAIGSLEGFVRVSGNVWGDTTSTSLNLKYYGVVRLSDSISSWNDLEDDFLDDGVTKRCKFINLQEYESSLFNIRYFYRSQHEDYTLARANKYGNNVNGPNSNGEISNINGLTTLFNSMWNDSAFNSTPRGGYYIDRLIKITSDITLSATTNSGITLTGNAASAASNDLEMFHSTSYRSFVRNVGNGSDVEYVLPAGSFIKTFSNNGTFLWYPVFDAVSFYEPLYSYPGATEIQAANDPNVDESTLLDQGTETYTNNNGQVETINTPQKSINLFPADNIIISPADGGPGGNQATTWTGNPTRFRYMHYRNSKYEILPVDREIDQDIWKGLRILHENADNSASGANGALSPFILNTTNKLSVYTFANTIIESKELCCPPLDTSPPFDSSEIGLSTTILNPDFHVDGLVNVRSLSATHSEDKIFAIPSNVNNTQLPVDQKLEIVFGGVKYDLLIGNTKTF